MPTIALEVGASDTRCRTESAKCPFLYLFTPPDTGRCRLFDKNTVPEMTRLPDCLTKTVNFEPSFW